MSKKSQEKYKLAGKCILCGENPPRDSRVTCESCGKRSRKYSKTRTDKFITNGKCCVCGEKELVTKRHCEGCARKHQESSKKNYLIMRDGVFNAYGGYKCVCCMEEEKAFLTIDHINGNGNRHRKEIGQSNMYRWLRDNNYPSGFQVLCMNCQWGKKNCGICPHKARLQDEERREVRKSSYYS